MSSQRTTPEVVDALVLAGGSGARMGGQGNKVYRPVVGEPMVVHPLRVLAAAAVVRDLHLVVRRSDLPDAHRLVARLRLPGLGQPVIGGSTRPASERAGLAALRPGAGYVLIHDGARPVLSPGLLHRLCEAAFDTGGAVPVIDFDTPVFAVDGRGLLSATDPPHGRTRDHGRLHRVQTPQVFARTPLLAAYAAAAATGFEGLDTADTVQHFSDLPIAAVEGDPDNLKVTYPADLARAAQLLARRAP